MASDDARKPRAVHTGDALGRYVLEDELGEGGMATVYRARDRELRREVAVKVLFPHLARRADVVRRFQREARAAAGLEHPNILRVYDVGGGDVGGGDVGESDAGEPPYIVMELVRGRSLLGEVEARGAMLAEIAACIGALLADALAAAHAAGIIHRDVKPANALVADGGRVLLADFGVARLDGEGDDSLVTKTGTVLGTPAYMSPEQAAGETATRASDVYSLGATLYQLATGSLPYSGPPAKILSAIATGARTPAVRRRPSIGGELSRAIDRLMALDAGARPSAIAAARELRALAADGGLGEPADELAAYFADPDAYARGKLPIVLAAIARRARVALGKRQPALAMALADRASALAPDDPIAAALVTAVTSRDAAARTRQRVLVGGGGVAVVAALAFGAVRLAGSRGGGVNALDAAATMPARDAAATARNDTAPIDAAPIDAAIALAAPTRDAAIVLSPPVADARGAIAVHARDAATPAPTPTPAIAEADAAEPALAELAIHADTWCELSIDDHPRGRLVAAPIAIEPGHHHIACAQPSLGHTWSEDVELAPGQHLVLTAHVLPSVQITIGPVRGAVTVDGASAATGAVLHLAHGPHRFVEAGGDERYLTIAADCTLRDKTDERGQLVLDCF